MMPLPSELISFDFKPHMHSMLAKSFGDQTAELQKLEDFVARLEEERLKIDAFKRELPLCMQLLTNAMEASRQQLQTQKASQLGATVTPVLEEFMPIKNPNSSNSDNEGKAVSSDKANWMTSAQLWNQESEHINKVSGSQLILASHDHHEEPDIKLGLNGKAQRSNGCAAAGAFNPFGSKDSIICSEGFPELALASSTEGKKSSPEQRDNPGKYSNSNTTDQKEASTSSGQTHRKARRCWSPDLHRRFVNALHMLGGSQVATPKQIRELMKVDGLTNDEVKSHLQKYRLHTRRPSPSTPQAVTAAPQVVVLGGIWVPPEYAAAAAAHGGAPTAALYSPHAAAASHHHVSPPSAFCSLAQAQGSYPQPPHPGHQQLHLYSSNKPPLSMQKSGSPERGVTGDRSESIEDGKSESGSWKADSGGENGGGERRGMDVGDESNASVRSLKF